MPVLTGASAVPASTPVAAVPAPAPLNQQLAGPIATLAAGPHGDRTLTVNVAPEGLGPVTVKAHLGADGLRVELLAPTDAGRDALRGMLGDLRRDLAVLGHGSVGLSTPARQDAGFAGTGGGAQQGQTQAGAGQTGTGGQSGSAGHPMGAEQGAADRGPTRDSAAGSTAGGPREGASAFVPASEAAGTASGSNPYSTQLDVLA
ncbi:flagellar hook-length control protein FliK [Arthrobacter sp. JSM 101049]|uniref:flagellar hook-length control protein FliK n=1 Tax=Arthrobacter sp. JSM 101049 TaxID=929097 RepID=UPI0035672BC0